MANENLIEKAAQWSLDLSSDSSNFVSADLAAALLQEHQFPLELDSEDQVQWNKIQEQSEGVVDFITRVSKLRHANSLLAANRYYPLLKLYEKHPSNIRFTLLLAECYYLMEDTFGGLLLFKQALELLQESGVDNDPVLEQTIAHIQVLVQFEIEEADTDQDDFSEDGELDIISYTRPPNWDRSSTPSNLVSLQIKWAELQLQGDGAQQFVRLACVTTNELEGVFNLTGDSAKKLARCGLYANSIEGISKRSRTKDPDKVIAILKNTEKCINMLNPVIEGKAEFSEQLLKQMHRQLLEDDNIDALKVGDYYCFVVTPMGRFRKAGCHAEHPEKGYVTVFCPPSRLEEEIKWFFDQVRAVLADQDLDPFRACAFIQFAFLRIHPFADGNGRLGRMVSSIPLLKADLPPVIVSLASKSSYFDALQVADTTGDVDILARFLQDESFRAIQALLEYTPGDSPPQIRRARTFRAILQNRAKKQADRAR